jgi:glycerophosphoryl diester phosphodiesterase
MALSQNFNNTLQVNSTGGHKDTKTFTVHGHRGFGVEKPENTMSAFKESIKVGLDFVELDVWLTKDLIPVVIHADSELGFCKMRKISDHSAKEIFITKTTYAELSTLEYIKSDESVPTFEEVVILFKNTNTKINMEIKDWSSAVIKLCLDIIMRYGVSNSVFFSSFNHDHRLTLFEEEQKRRISPRIGFGYLCDTWCKIPKWNRIKETLLEDHDLLILDTEMFLHFNEEWQEAKFQAELHGVHMALYIGFEFVHLETEEFFDQCVADNIKAFITNVPSSSMSYKKKKEGPTDDGFSLSSFRDLNVSSSPEKIGTEY